jgi:hypothetical protein
MATQKFKFSTGIRDAALGTAKFGKASYREQMQGMVLKIFSGAAPASVDDAQTGTLLCTITNNAATVAAKQKLSIAITPVNAATYTVTIDGVAISYTADGTATAAEICDGLVAFINAVTLGVVASNDGSDNLLIEAGTAGVPFEYAVTDDDTGTNLVVTVAVEDAYGLHFETDALATDGELEKDAAQIWSGINAATGTAGYARFVEVGDAGGASTTAKRVQGAVNTANAPVEVSSVSFVVAAYTNITAFKLTLPEVSA